MDWFIWEAVDTDSGLTYVPTYVDLLTVNFITDRPHVWYCRSAEQSKALFLYVIA